MLSTHPEEREHHAESHDFSSGPNRKIWKLIVRRFEVLHEHLTAALRVIAQVVNETPVLVGRDVREIPYAHVNERATLERERVDQRGPYGYLYPLNCIYQRQTELAIKGVT